MNKQMADSIDHTKDGECSGCGQCCSAILCVSDAEVAKIKKYLKLNIQQEYNFIESVINGAAVAIGFTLALVLLAGIRERIEYAAIPGPFKGVPIAFISAGLLAMAFMGFSGMQI